MSSTTKAKKVRFHLFGRFRAIVDDTEVQFKDAKFFTYLKLYLLSGESYLDNNEEWSFWDIAKDVRDPLIEGNEPRDETRGRGGRFDFKGITGLTFRYTEKLGIGIEPDIWSSDVQDFEEAWRRRTEASSAELQQALDSYGKGVDLSSWKKEPTFIKNYRWIKARISVLDERRKDLRAELDQRPTSEKSGTDAEGNEAKVDEQGTLSGEKASHNETSGFARNLGEPGIAEKSSAPVGGSLRDVAFTADGPEVEGLGDANTTSSDPLQEPAKESAEPINSPNPPQNSTEENSGNSDSTLKAPGEKTWSPYPPPRRTVTALGVVVVATLVVVIFATGYYFSSLSNREPETLKQDRRVDSGSGGRTTKSGSQANKGSSTDYDSIVRAPGTSVELQDLFLQNLSQSYVKHTNREVIIGRQVFSPHIYSNSSSNHCIPSYKLDGEFNTLKCVIGVPDVARNFDSKSDTVVFEGDGRVLDRIKVTKRTPVPVTLSVKDVKVLIITFRNPVVIAAPIVER